MKWKAISKPANGLTARSGKLELLSKLLKVLVIVIILLLNIILLTGCAANSPVLPRENCRRHVVTYGDAVECMIKLDERQAQNVGK